MGAYECVFRGAPDQEFPGNLPSRTTSVPPVPNGNFPGTVPFGAQQKSSNFFVDVQGPSSHQLGRPPGRLKGGVWGGGAPPSEKKV